MRENASLPNLVASAARTTDHVSAWLTNEGHTHAHVIVNVTAAQGATASFKVHVQGRVPGSTAAYDLLVSPSIAATGVNVLKIGPGFAASANAAAQDILPLEWRVTSTAQGAQTLTYSIGAQLGI